MIIKEAFFTGTGTTKKIVTTLGNVLGKEFDSPVEVFDFSLPKNRESALIFNEEDLVILGVPVIAGRVPNLLLNYLNSIEGNGAKAIAIVLYGNRDYGDSLIELKDILVCRNFKVIGAGAFVGEHSFSKTLAKGRPDSKDISIVKEFAKEIANKIRKKTFGDIYIKGTEKPYRPYYVPKKENGEIINILKVKPETDNNCVQCGYCSENCRTGAISRENNKEIIGRCMKCCHCIKNCKMQAKFFRDAGYIYHKEDLEKKYKNRKDAEYFC